MVWFSLELYSRLTWHGNKGWIVIDKNWLHSYTDTQKTNQRCKIKFWASNPPTKISQTASIVNCKINLSPKQTPGKECHWFDNTCKYFVIVQLTVKWKNLVQGHWSSVSMHMDYNKPTLLLFGTQRSSLPTAESRPFAKDDMVLRKFRTTNLREKENTSAKCPIPPTQDLHAT